MFKPPLFSHTLLLFSIVLGLLAVFVFTDKQKLRFKEVLRFSRGVFTAIFRGDLIA